MFVGYFYYHMTPKSLIHKQLPGCYDRERMVVGLQLPVQSVLITTKVMSSNLVHYEMYSIQHYRVKFVRDLRPVGGVLLVLRFSPPIKLTTMI